MAPVGIDASYFSPDTRAFIELLHAHGVRYLIVGGEAVIFHGHVRLTGDVDFFFSNEEGNVERLFEVLEQFWDGDVPGLSAPEDLSPAGTVVQFGVPPNRIDLINEIEGVDFKVWTLKRRGREGSRAGSLWKAVRSPCGTWGSTS